MSPHTAYYYTCVCVLLIYPTEKKHSPHAYERAVFAHTCVSHKDVGGVLYIYIHRHRHTMTHTHMCVHLYIFNPHIVALHTHTRTHTKEGISRLMCENVWLHCRKLSHLSLKAPYTSSLRAHALVPEGLIH
jgi:hypothetical protein